MIRFLISVPTELHELLKAAATVKGQTLNGFIRGILWDWVQSHQDVTEPSR